MQPSRYHGRRTRVQLRKEKPLAPRTIEKIKARRKEPAVNMDAVEQEVEMERRREEVAARRIADALEHGKTGCK